MRLQRQVVPMIHAVSRVLTGTAILCLASTVCLAAVNRAPYGTTRDGERIEAFTLNNAHGMSVRLLSLGASIDQVNVPDRRGQVANVVVALPNLAAYETDNSFNRTVGRFANRLVGPQISIDGENYALPVSANGILMHGGPEGFGRKNWQANVVSTEHADAVAFSLTSPDGASGFPGTMQVTVTYTLDDSNALHIEYRARTDKATVINLTNHTYFNLAGNASRDVYDHVLQVMADEYTPANEAQVPTGQYASVDGTPFDFRKPVRIGARIQSSHPQMLIARGLDHNFVLSRTARTEPALAVHIIDPASGRQMEVRTTEPGVQIYTANGFNGSKVGAAGTTLRQGYGIAVETQHVPDSPNKPQFPSTILRPGEEFRSSTLFRFSVDAVALADEKIQHRRDADDRDERKQ